MKIQSVVVFIFTVFATQSFTVSAPINEKFHCTPKITLYTNTARCTCNDDGKSVTCLQKSQPHGAYSNNEMKYTEDKLLYSLLLRIKMLNKKVNNIDRQDKEAKRKEEEKNERIKQLNVSKTEMIKCTPKITVHTSEGTCTCNDDGKSITCPKKSHAHGSHSKHESEDKENKRNEHRKKLRKELLWRIKKIQERVDYIEEDKAEEEDNRMDQEENERQAKLSLEVERMVSRERKNQRNLQNFHIDKPIYAEKFDTITNEIMKEAHRYDIKPRIKPYEPRKIKDDHFDFHPMIHIL